jgi:hypothetical protein
VEPSLTSCGTVGSHHIFCNDIFRTFQVDEWTIKLSLREYLVMHKLTCGQPVSVQLLLQEVYGNEQAPANEEPLGRLLERLRKKLHAKGQESPALLKAGMNWPSLFGEGGETLQSAETCLRMPQEQEGKRS